MKTQVKLSVFLEKLKGKIFKPKRGNLGWGPSTSLAFAKYERKKRENPSEIEKKLDDDV